MALAQTIGQEGKTGHAIIVQIVYFWFDLAVLPLPFHKLLWLYAPYAMALVALLLLAWTASGGCGRFVALRTPARGLAASPLILSTQAADSYHGTTWFGAALLAAYLCWLLTSRPRLMTTVAVGVVVALLVGFATASDPLLAPTGDTPFAAALGLAWLVRRKEVETRALLTRLGGLAGGRVLGGAIVGSVRGLMRASLLAVIAYWSASAVFLAAAFVFSDVPSDFVENSARYLVSMFFVAVATVPVWAGQDPRRLAAIAVPASIFIIGNAVSVEQDASAGWFENSFSVQLPGVISFLEAQGLTRGYAAYDEASPMTLKSDFHLLVRPVTDQFASDDERCAQPICPYAYNSVSDWYQGGAGPTFILLDPEMARLGQPPPDTLDPPANVLHVGRFAIYVYADDVASHMGIPAKFTRTLL